MKEHKNRSANILSSKDDAFVRDASKSKGQDSKSSGIVAGRNAVRELLRSGAAIDKILVSGKEGSITVIVAEARKRGVPVLDVDGAKLDRLSCGAVHQGVLAYASQKEYSSVEDILALAKERNESPLIAIADGVEDPHNLGALIRCSEIAGCHGVIIPKRRSSGLTPVVTKASAGAIWHMPVARVANIAQTIEFLKENGIWTFAAEAGGSAYYETDFNLPAAIVFGSEGEGVGRLVKDRCDFVVSIPMYGRVNSLNVSTAAAVILCHAARMQRVGK